MAAPKTTPTKNAGAFAPSVTLVRSRRLAFVGVVLLSASLTGCGDKPEVRVPSYLKDANGDAVELTPDALETLAQEAKSLQAKREAEKSRGRPR